MIDDVELNMKRGQLFRDILYTWDESDLRDALDMGKRDYIDLIIENDVFRPDETEEIMKRPEYRALRRKNGLGDELEIVRLCGGAKDAAEERALYEAAMGRAS